MDSGTITLSREALQVAARLRNLRDFLELLEENGQCVRWPETVMPEPDIREIAYAIGRDSATGPAVIIDRIRGYPGKRLALGVHGSFANLALMLGKPKGASIRELFFDIIGRWGADSPRLSHIAFDKAPVHTHRIEKDINLYDLLPLYRVNEYDGGFYLAKASTVSHDPRAAGDFGKQNVGMYRIQVHGPDLMTINSVPSHDLGTQIRIAEAEGLPLRVAVMIGTHPAMAMFAATPVHYDESEFAYASQMMGSTFELTKSGNGLDILAECEMVIEAELIHNSRPLEGPFGEFPGSYAGIKRVPMFKVTAVSHRPDPIFENIHIGKGWTEHDTLIGLNTSAPIYAQLKKSFPEVAAVNALYQHGFTAIVSVKNRYAGFAKSVAMAALGTPHGLMYLKNLILVDDDVDCFDLNDVMWALSTRTRADDIIVLPNMPMMLSDPAAVVRGKGHRLIIDATSFMAPDPIRKDTSITKSPSPDRIYELAKIVKQLQEGAK